MNSIGSSPFGFNYQAMAERQQTIAQSQLDYQKASDTATKANETQAGGGALASFGKGIKGAKDLKNKIQGGADRVSQLADRLEGKFQQVSQMGEDLKGQIKGQLTESTKPSPSQGEEFDFRDANANLPSGVKPLSVGDYGSTGESTGRIADLSPPDFAQARGTISTTLQGKYDALNQGQKAEFDTHMANNMKGSQMGNQANLDTASAKLDELNPMSGGNDIRPPGSVRATLGRAMGDMDGTTQLGSSELTGASLTRNLVAQAGDINPFSEAKSLGQRVVQGATNLHGDIQNGVQQVGRFAQNTAQKIGDAGETLGKGLDAGIGMGEGIVDSLGPIGDIIGLGMAIFGGVKAHQEHKEEEASAEAQQKQISSLPTTQSINTSSVGVGGSTGNPLQGQSMGHY